MTLQVNLSTISTEADVYVVRKRSESIESIETDRYN
jgi:hypothetical protein